jgi:hypothetical protein
MGPLSPLDSTLMTLGDADIAVVYSRPSVRGRAIWGEQVPWNEVWRTGANAATVLRTSQGITIGDRAVPAGSYSLFTLNTPTATTLIISTETMRDGRPLAGTAFDPAHVFARIPMTTTAWPSPVEQFTIAIEPSGDRQGTLVLAWDRRRMSVPLIAP